MQENPYLKRLFLMHGNNMCHKIAFMKKKNCFHDRKNFNPFNTVLTKCVYERRFGGRHLEARL